MADGVSWVLTDPADGAIRFYHNNCLYAIGPASIDDSYELAQSSVGYTTYLYGTEYVAHDENNSAYESHDDRPPVLSKELVGLDKVTISTTTSKFHRIAYSGDYLTVKPGSLKGFEFVGWAVSASTSYGTYCWLFDQKRINNGYNITNAEWSFKAQYGTISRPLYNVLVSNPGEYPAIFSDGSFRFFNPGRNASNVGTRDTHHVFAIFKEKTVTVTYDSSGGQVDKISDVIRGDNGLTSLPVPIRDGYTFKGWADVDKNIVTASQDAPYLPNSDITLYAQWTANKYTVTFDANGGSGVTQDSKEVTFDGRYGTLPTATRLGYSFIGWSLTEDGENPVEASTTVSTPDDHTLYAKWKGISIKVTKGLVDGEADDIKNIGTLQLFLRPTVDSEFNLDPVAESVDGVLSYGGASRAGSLERPAFLLKCEMSDSGSDRLYEALGVKDASMGGYVQSYGFTVGAYEGEDVQFNDFATTYWLRRKNLYSLDLKYYLRASSVAGSDAGVLEIVKPLSPDYEGKYIEGGIVTVKVTPPKMYMFLSAKIEDSENNSRGEFSKLKDDNTLDVTMGGDYTLKVYFSKRKFEVRADVDAASKDAVSVSVEGTDSDYKVEAEANVTFRAAVNDGYLFDGWYAGGGAKVSESAEYSVSVTDNMTLFAKAKVAVSVGMKFGNDGDKETCFLKVNGERVESVDGDAVCAFHVTLGDSFSYELTLGKRTDTPSLMGDDGMWYFNGWFGDVETPSSVLDLPQTGTIKPVSGFDMTALVLSYAKAIKIISVTVGTLDYSAGEVPGFNGINAYELDDSTITFSKGRPPVGTQGMDPVQPFRHQITGVSYIAITATESLPTGEVFNYFADENGGVLTNSNKITLLAVQDIKLRACYGSPSRVRTTLAYAIGSNETMGNFAVASAEDEEAEFGEDFKSVLALQGTIVKAVTTSMNGYKFDGWYDNADGNGTPLATDIDSVISVTTERTIYAKFRQDTTAIYEWEGSSENKSMEWVSKTYASNTPMAFAACRVDAIGYRPKSIADLTVESFSSPDAAPTRSVKLSNIATQGGRRIPVMRPEKFSRIKIEANTEIDVVTVSTSMGGLAV